MNSIGDDLARAYEDGYANGFRDGTEKAQERIDAAPTIDPARHARWEQDDTWKDLYFCSACIGRDHRNNPKYKYCPDCGARMDAEEENDE